LVPPLAPSAVEDLDPEADPIEVIAKLSALCQLQ
jgi:hypothetical protein